MTPNRIQRKRTAGWTMPLKTIYVGRPTEWGNPFSIEKFGLEWSVELYDRMLRGPISGLGEYGIMAIMSYRENVLKESPSWRHITVQGIQRELRGKNLACWCPLDQPCHADILLDIANTVP